MELSVQEAVQDLITALIKSLGSSNGKLLTLMRTCPPGSESLALRVLTIFTEHGRPSAQLVALVKGLISDRDLDARFLIPIIAEMDKVCPRDECVALLNIVSLAGHSKISSSDCLHSERSARAQEPGSVRIQLGCHHTSANIWERVVKFASCKAK